jgi:HSP20 family protein
MSKHKDKKADNESTNGNAVEAVQADTVVPFWQALAKWPDWKSLFGVDTMKVEQFNDNGNMVLRVEIPGVDPDKDVKVTVDDGVLRVHAERSSSSETKNAEELRSEFSYGSFDRAVRLPVGADEKNVTASYRDGILEVKVPVDRQATASHEVAISRA